MNLAKIRKARGLSQRALAEMIGMDPATVNRAEAMHHTAKLATYIACADVLGVTLNEIFADDLTPAARQIIEAFRHMPEEQRQRTAELLDLVSAPREPSA